MRELAGAVAELVTDDLEAHRLVERQGRRTGVRPQDAGSGGPDVLDRRPQHEAPDARALPTRLDGHPAQLPRVRDVVVPGREDSGAADDDAVSEGSEVMDIGAGVVRGWLDGL